MQFIASYWMLWLILMVAFGGYALHNQLRRMKQVLSMDVEGASNGLGALMVSGLLASASGVLLLIAIIVNIMHS